MSVLRLCWAVTFLPAAGFAIGGRLDVLRDARLIWFCASWAVLSLMVEVSAEMPDRSAASIAAFEALLPAVFARLLAARLPVGDVLRGARDGRLLGRDLGVSEVIFASTYPLALVTTIFASVSAMIATCALLHGPWASME